MPKKSKNMRVAPTEPELFRQGNGLFGIRYGMPSKTDPKHLMLRVHKLGFGLDNSEQQRRLAEFKKEQVSNRRGTTLMVVPQPETQQSAAYLKGKTPAEADAIRARARDYYRKARADKKTNGSVAVHHDTAHDELADIQDHMGVLIANVQSISTVLKMLQNRVAALQAKRRR